MLYYLPLSNAMRGNEDIQHPSAPEACTVCHLAVLQRPIQFQKRVEHLQPYLHDRRREKKGWLMPRLQYQQREQEEWLAYEDQPRLVDFYDRLLLDTKDELLLSYQKFETHPFHSSRAKY